MGTPFSQYFQHNSAGGDLDIDVEHYRYAKRHVVHRVLFLSRNPSDTDADTTAVDVSFDPDTDDIEIAALAAQEYNDTDVHAQFGSVGVPIPIPLSTRGLSQQVRDFTGAIVPAGKLVEITMTNVGAGADTEYAVLIEGEIDD